MISPHLESDAAPPASGGLTDGQDVDSAVMRMLNQHGSCALDELVLGLTRFTFNQVLMSVDRLSREGKVTLRRPKRFDYIVSALMSEPRSQRRP